MEVRQLTDEELAWQIAREMEEEEVRQEQKDAEMARLLAADFELQPIREEPRPYNPFLEDPIPVPLLPPKMPIAPGTPPAIRRIFCDFSLFEHF
jgi:hypothetical protein